MNDRRRAVILTALIVMSTGAAIPWGLSTGAHERSVHAIEAVLSILHLIVAVALATSFVYPPMRRAADEALVLAAGVWAATSVLLGWLLPGATVHARFGLGIMFAAPAVLAFGAYTVERRGAAR